MRDAQKFNFTEGFDTFGVPDALPQLPLSLTYRGSSAEVLALDAKLYLEYSNKYNDPKFDNWAFYDLEYS
jgi:hypothetical protein